MISSNQTCYSLKPADTNKQEEFDLSNKEIWAEIDYENGNTGSILVFPSKDVKEFIRRIIEHIDTKSPDRIEAIKFIKELAGEKLK